MTTDIAALNPALEQFIRQRVVKQYNRSHTSANLIRKEIGMGKNLAWDISVGTAEGQVFDDGEVVTTFNADVEKLATLPWSEYGDAFKITGRAEDGAQFSRTELGNTWMFKMIQARERAAAKVNADIWSGDGSGSPQRLYGLTMASAGPLSVSGTYAGTMDRSAYPQTQGITLGNGGIPRGLSLSLILYGLEQVFNASGKTPTYGLTTANIWRVLGELDGGRRTMVDAYVRGEKLMASHGFEFVEVNGIPVFKDVSVPSGYLGFFSDDSICLEYLPTAPARIARGKIMATVPLAGTPQEQGQDFFNLPQGANVPLVANIIALPSQGNFESWMLDATMGLRVDRPNAHLLIKDIAFRAE